MGAVTIRGLLGTSTAGPVSSVLDETAICLDVESDDFVVFGVRTSSQRQAAACSAPFCFLDIYGYTREVSGLHAPIGRTTRLLFLRVFDGRFVCPLLALARGFLALLTEQPFLEIIDLLVLFLALASSDQLPGWRADCVAPSRP